MSTISLLPVSGESLGLQLRGLRRFLRSPKGYLLLALVALLLVAAPSTGSRDASRVVVAAVLSAVLLELGCVRLRTGAWQVPSSAMLSGLIVALVLSAQEPWYVAVAAGVLATASKHVVRLGRGHFLNPAAVGLVVVYVLFGSGQSWWGALPGLPGVAALIVLAAGFIVACRANKLPAILAFCGAYVSLFTVAAVAGHATQVADIYRPPFINMALFFACFMVTDPPTSPVAFVQQVVFGTAVALVSFATFMATHGLYFLLSGLLVANLGYGVWQQVRALQRHRTLSTTSISMSTVHANRNAGNALAWSGIAAVLLLAAGIALFQRTRSGSVVLAGGNGPAGDASAATRPGSAAQTVPRGALSGRSFQDHFTGSVTQSNGASGGTLDFDITGSGERAVRLTIHLTMSTSAGRSTQVTGNEATLLDGSGVRLCQGTVTQLDNGSFTVRCAGSGGTSAMEVVGTITGGTATQIEGDLQAAPLAS